MLLLCQYIWEEERERLLARKPTQHMRGLVVASHRLLHRDKVTAITAVSFVNRPRSFGSNLVQFGLERSEMGFESKHSLDSSKVESLVSEFLNAPKHVDIGVAIATATALGAGRLQ